MERAVHLEALPNCASRRNMLLRGTAATTMAAAALVVVVGGTTGAPPPMAPWVEIVSSDPLPVIDKGTAARFENIYFLLLLLDI